MLTQGPTEDLNCKLIISSFLTLPHIIFSPLYKEYHAHGIVIRNDVEMG